jgi:FHA domain
VSTILYPHLPNVVDHLYQRIAAPPVSVAAQSEAVLPLVVGGLLLLLIVALVLFWRMSRKPQSPSPTPAEKPGTAPTLAVVPPPPLPAAIALEFITETEQRISFTLDKPALTIGRASDNDIVVTAPILNVDTISQHHARLRRDQEGYVVRDLGSKNGLAVNGRHTLENLLQDGDRLQFGEAEAIFHQVAGGAA